MIFERFSLCPGRGFDGSRERASVKPKRSSYLKHERYCQDTSRTSKMVKMADTPWTRLSPFDGFGRESIRSTQYRLFDVKIRQIPDILSNAQQKDIRTDEKQYITTQRVRCSGSADGLVVRPGLETKTLRRTSHQFLSIYYCRTPSHTSFIQ